MDIFENRKFAINAISGLRWSALVLALVGLMALVAHIAGILPMSFFITFFGVPSLLLLFMLAAFARKINSNVFLNCMLVGLIGGIIGTFAYDLVRLILWKSTLLDYNGFYAIQLFGSWITGSEVSSTQAIVLGWIYHFWNGASFGIFYTLAFGRTNWKLGVAYGVFMELLMLGLFPFFITVTQKTDFIILSMIGHIFYGLVLGLIAQKYALNWKDA